MQTLGGFVIDDTVCNGPLCTPTTASTFSGNTTGLGIGCVDSCDIRFVQHCKSKLDRRIKMGPDFG